MITLPAATTALILIDLQKGIVGLPLAPYSAEAVISKGVDLARRFRAAKAPVVLVNVAFSPDHGDALKAPVDQPPPTPSGGFLEGWTELVDGLAEPSDLRVTKHQWGAFYGTDLDLQLRRRGVTNIVLCGIATSIGVESTARNAFERAYNLTFAADAMTDVSLEAHERALSIIFPRIGEVGSTDEIVAKL